MEWEWPSEEALADLRFLGFFCAIFNVFSIPLYIMTAKAFSFCISNNGRRKCGAGNVAARRGGAWQVFLGVFFGFSK